MSRTKPPDVLVSKHSTQEEAIAAAAADLEPGGVVEIHEPHCARRGDKVDDPDACNCRPMEMIVGENN